MPQWHNSPSPKSFGHARPILVRSPSNTRRRQSAPSGGGNGQAMALLRQLYIQVLIGIALAIALGIAAPATAIEMKPLGDAFIALLRMMLGPIIFCSIVLGLTHVRDMRQLGRLAIKALVYFEVMTTIAMALGFVVVNLIEPGAGLHATGLVMSESVSK